MSFPHCDARVLHAPGECKFCDESGLQDVRRAWGIAFSGHKPEVDEYGRLEMTCPADLARPAGSSSDYRQWGGNVPYRGAEIGSDWAGYPITEADPRFRRSGRLQRWYRDLLRKHG